MDNTQQGSLVEFIEILFRHKIKIVGFFLVTMVAVLTVTMISPEVYRSDAKVLVRLGRESVSLDPTATTGKTISVSQNRENQINSEIEILRSRELIEQVVKELNQQGVTDSLNENKENLSAAQQYVKRIVDTIKEMTIGTAKKIFRILFPKHEISKQENDILKLMRGLNVNSKPNSNIISISYETDHPKRAKKIIDKLIEYYLDKHIAVHRTVGSYEFFTQETDLLREKITQNQKALRDLKNEMGIASIEGQRDIVLKRLSGIKDEIQNLQATKASSESRIKALERLLAKQPMTITTQETSGYADSAVDKLRERIYELKMNEQDLLSRYNEDSTSVKEIQRQIDEAEKLLKNEQRSNTQVTKGLNEAYQKLAIDLADEQADLVALEAKSTALNDQLKQVEGDLQRINDYEVATVNLQRELKLNESNYQKYADNQEQARIDQALEFEKISNISVVQQATLPIEPIKPRKSRNILMGFFVGIFGGLALAIVFEYFNHTFRKPFDIEKRLKLPALASIPKLHGRKVKILTTGVDGEKPLLPSGKDSVSGTELTVDTRSKEIKNYFDSLQERLLLLDEDLGRLPSALVVTSCHPREGVSTVATNIASSLMRYKRGPVLLVDTQRLENYEINGRYILSTRQYGTGSIRRYTAKDLKDLIDSLKEDYQHIIFDAPALFSVSSTARFARSADGVILVVEAGKVRWEVVQRGQYLLEQAQANIIGVVLNKRRFPIPPWLYKRI